MKPKLLLHALQVSLGLSLTLCLAHALPPGDTNDWNLVFDDKFDSFNPQTWGYGQFPNGEPYVGGHANQICSPLDTRLHVGPDGSYLQLRMRNTATNGRRGFGMPGRAKKVPYSGGTVWSRESFTYGYIEATQRVPSFVGAHPAFWLISRSTWPPEIDIAEFVDKPCSQMRHNLIIQKKLKEWEVAHKFWETNFTDTNWITYGVDWEPDYLAFYKNGKLIAPPFTGSAVPNTAMFIDFDCEFQNEASENTNWPQYYDIAGVHWWQRKSNANSGAILDGAPGHYPYSLRNRRTGLMLASAGKSPKTNPSLKQVSPGFGDEQQWTIKTASDGSRLIQFKPSIVYLAAHQEAGQTYSVLQGASDGHARWSLQSLGGQWFEIRNLATGLCLAGDSGIGRTNSESRLMLATPSPDKTDIGQQWEFIAPFFAIPAYAQK